MARLLLDTTVLIDALRGRPEVDRLRFARRAGEVAEGERAGRRRGDFAGRGTSLHQADGLIAAAAVNMKSTHWPVGS
jgi:predicted nucleic acid-binding protein